VCRVPPMYCLVWLNGILLRGPVCVVDVVSPLPIIQLVFRSIHTVHIRAGGRSPAGFRVEPDYIKHNVLGVNRTFRCGAHWSPPAVTCKDTHAITMTSVSGEAGQIKARTRTLLLMLRNKANFGIIVIPSTNYQIVTV